MKFRLIMMLVSVGWTAASIFAETAELTPPDAIPFLIPWPQEVKKTDAGNCVLAIQGEFGVEVLSPEKGFFDQARGLILEAAESMGFSRGTKQPSTRILIQSCRPEIDRMIQYQDFLLPLSESDISILSKSDQAYLIRISPGDQSLIWIIGASPLGAYYGACTLIQLFQKNDQGNLVIGGIEIRDYPDVPYRMSADWVLGLDWHGNGYDWGDGLEAFVTRCKRHIDFCSRHKVNLVRFLGGTILPGPDYAESRYSLVKRFAPELNRYARTKGVALQYAFSDWGMDYGEFGLNYPEPWAFNRATYPDGPIYSCLMGTVGDCLSNDALTGMIAERIKQFVRETEPGSIYLHHLDLDGSSQWPVYWSEKRCPRCQREWPDDDWTSPKGLAGAMAHFMNILISQVRMVQNPDSGYDASRDLQIVFASPYAGLDNDVYWDQYIRFWQNTGRLLVNKEKIQFVTREQFKRWDNRGFRTAQLARKMNEVRWSNAVFMFAIQGGGFWYGDRMFNTSPVFSNVWDGAGTLYNFNGHVHCEAQVLANVNYAWNNHAPGWVDLTDLKGKEVQQEAFRYIPKDTDSPQNSPYLYGDFLDQTCRRIYGEKAGPTVATMFRLEKDIGAIVPNVITLVRKKGSLQFNWLRQAERNQKALKWVNQAAAACDLPEAKKNLDHLAICLEASTKICTLCSGLYQQETQSAIFNQQADDLTAWLERNSGFISTEPDGGDVGYWKPMVQWARQEHELIGRKNTLPLAKYCTVQGSSCQKYYPAVSVLTSDPAGSQWGQNGGWQDNTANLFPDRLEFRFEPPQRIAGMTIYTLPDDRQNGEKDSSPKIFTKFGITDLDIEYKKPGGEWIVLSSIRQNRDIRIDVSANNDVEAIRLKILGSADGYYSRVVHVDFY